MLITPDVSDMQEVASVQALSLRVMGVVMLPHVAVLVWVTDTWTEKMLGRQPINGEAVFYFAIFHHYSRSKDLAKRVSPSDFLVRRRCRGE